MIRDPSPSDMRVGFWSPLVHPRSFVQSIAWQEANRDKIQQLAQIFRAGARLTQYRGWAECRICGARLGTADMGGYGWIWPEKAEHYPLAHGVWIPKYDRLLADVVRAQQPRGRHA